MPSELDNRRPSTSSVLGDSASFCFPYTDVDPQLRIPGYQQQQQQPLARQQQGMPRHRNMSGPTPTSTRPALDNRQLFTPPPTATASTGRDSRTRDGHTRRKISTQGSDVDNRNNANHGGRAVNNSARYKTELCRPFEESGNCKYGEKCQFAHGAHELRSLTRHPKYKTERCRTFHSLGLCPYGPRCHFIHNESERGKDKNYNDAPNAPQKAGGFSARQHRPSDLSVANSSVACNGESLPSPDHLSSPGRVDNFPTIGMFTLPSDSVSNPEPFSSPDSAFTFPTTGAEHGKGQSVLSPLNVETCQFFSNVQDLSTISMRCSSNNNSNGVWASQNRRNNNLNSYNVNSDYTFQALRDLPLGPLGSQADEDPLTGTTLWQRLMQTTSTSPVSMSSTSDNDEHMGSRSSSPLESVLLPMFSKLSTATS